MVEYGVLAGKASTAVARSDGARCDRYISASVYSSWSPLRLRLAHWLQRLASFAGSTDTCPWSANVRDLGCVLARRSAVGSAAG